MAHPVLRGDVRCVRGVTLRCGVNAAGRADLLDFVDLLLKFLDVLLRVRSSSVGAVQSHFQLVDVLLQFLLAAKCFRLAARLRLEARLHRVQRPLVIAAETSQTTSTVIEAFVHLRQHVHLFSEQLTACNGVVPTTESRTALGRIYNIYISRESETTRNVYWSRASVCLSLALFPHYCMDPDVTW